MRPTILLFDVDGTLITTGGAARHALEVALGVLTGVAGYRAEFSFGGMTDRAIMRAGLEQAGVAPDDAVIDRAIEGYLERLDAVLADAPRYVVHRGVEAALDAATALSHVAVGLGTGNVERGARIKLARVGLNPYFPFGGFGCDAESRPILIRRGAERGAQRLRLPLDRCRVVVVGDTDKDVQAARANGFESFAVATGGVGADVLAESEPDWLFDDLSAPGAREALVGS